MEKLPEGFRKIATSQVLEAKQDDHGEVQYCPTTAGNSLWMPKLRHTLTVSDLTNVGHKLLTAARFCTSSLMHSRFKDPTRHEGG